MNLLLSDKQLSSLFTYTVEYMGETYTISNKILNHIDDNLPIEDQYAKSHDFLMLISCFKDHYESLLEDYDMRYKRLYNHTSLFLHSQSKADVFQWSGNMFQGLCDPVMLIKAEKTTPTDAQVKASIPYVTWELPNQVENFFHETLSLSELETKLKQTRKTLRRLTSSYELLLMKENRLRSLNKTHREREKVFA